MENYICVSRPRRFGKSMALKMLAAYYACGCDSTDLKMLWVPVAGRLTVGDKYCGRGGKNDNGRNPLWRVKECGI